MEEPSVTPFDFGKKVLAPLVVSVSVAAVIGISGFALGHTQIEGHPVMAERVNDSLVRVGRLEVETEALEIKTHELEIAGVDDRFRGVDADAMEARLQDQLDVIKRDLGHMKSELDKIKQELGIR